MTSCSALVVTSGARMIESGLRQLLSDVAAGQLLRNFRMDEDDPVRRQLVFDERELAVLFVLEAGLGLVVTNLHTRHDSQERCHWGTALQIGYAPCAI